VSEFAFGRRGDMRKYAWRQDRVCSKLSSIQWPCRDNFVPWNGGSILGHGFGLKQVDSGRYHLGVFTIRPEQPSLKTEEGELQAAEEIAIIRTSGRI
jgi:hypothetical protein